MNPASSRGVIVVRRPLWKDFGGGRSFHVWIDGNRAGKVRPGEAAEFAVEPGEHTIVVSMAWLHSPAESVTLAAGSRTEFWIGGSPVLKVLVPVLVAVVSAPFIIGNLRAIGGLIETHSWLRWLACVAIIVALFGCYAMVASKLVRDYWAVWTLKRVPAGPGIEYSAPSFE